MAAIHRGDRIETVLSLDGADPVLLRQAWFRKRTSSRKSPDYDSRSTPGGSHALPGLHAEHYSPRTPMLLVTGHVPESGRVALLWIRHSDLRPRPCAARRSDSYAAALYATLHALDVEGWTGSRWSAPG